MAGHSGQLRLGGSQHCWKLNNSDKTFASSQAANQAGCQQMWQALYAGLQHIERMCFTSKEFGQLLLQQNRTYFVPLMTNHTPALLCHSLDIAIAWCSSGLEILDPEEVEYIRYNATATVGGSVTLDCGSTMPTIFIWGFTKPGTDNNVAVAYNYGQGPKLQSQSSSLGHMQVLINTSALVIEELQRDAEGMYTCQALYDTDEGARITFYFTRLDVKDD
ncbi:hypothetical protein ABVT39_006612 [Epinephelus coioides]